MYECTRLLCPTADDAWLSKQLKNGSSWPRTSEAADGGKRAYPEIGLQIAENPLEGGASRDLLTAETRLAAHVEVLSLPRLARSSSPKMPCIRLLGRSNTKRCCTRIVIIHLTVSKGKVL